MRMFLTGLLLLSTLTSTLAVDVLFIGNSYTAGMKRHMGGFFDADEAPHHIAYITPGGATLKRHAGNKKVLKAIASRKWDYVVLQEQSQIPSFPDAAARMNPAGEKLNEAIQKQGAKTVLFLTWGRRDGDKKNRADDTFAEMQKRLQAGYEGLAEHIDATIAPVGPAWVAAQANGDDLWAKDGSHPSSTGGYLAAGVFYRVLTGNSPAGNSYTGNLPKDDAKNLQSIAADAVSQYAEREKVPVE